MKKWGIVMILVVGLIALVAGVSAWSSASVPVAAWIYRCDFEGIDTTGKKPRFLGENTLFRNGQTQNAETSRSGKFSCKVSKKKKYGMAWDIDTLRPGECFIATIWRKGAGDAGRLTAQSSWQPLRTARTAISKDVGGWEKLSLFFEVPDTLLKGTFKFYVWYTENDTGAAWFDDLSIERFPPGSRGAALTRLDQLIKGDQAISWEPIPGLSIQSYLDSTSERETFLKVKSFYSDTLRVLGIGDTPENMHTKLSQPLDLPPNPTEFPLTYTRIQFPGPAGKHLFFEVKRTGKTFTEPILPWKYPATQTTRQSLFQNLNITSNEVYEVAESEISFTPGVHQIEKDLLFPAGYTLSFPPGCTLKISKGSKFISWSPISMNGTEEEPILIDSPDSSAAGFAVLKAADTSRIQHVIFRHLQTLDFERWILTGAVTFYESPLKASHLTIENNHCEDALNLVRSAFDISELTLTNIQMDGFDADFCTGSIRQSTFVNIGNDAMDFSGSQIQVATCRIAGAGDKGISVGEEATVEVISAEINGANIGVAAKDLSVLTIRQLTLADCKIGFAAYQKKPEYGPGKIIVQAYTSDQVTRLQMIEEGSIFETLQ